MTKFIKKFLSAISGKTCYQKPLKPMSKRPIEHFAIFQHVSQDGNDCQIKYGWHVKTSKLMKVGDYARLPEAQAAGLYQAIISKYGAKSAKTRTVFANRTGTMKVVERVR
jgi:hypothetical protein